MLTRLLATVCQGMGEPLNNWEPVKLAVRAMVDPTMFGLKRSKVPSCFINSSLRSFRKHHYVVLKALCILHRQLLRLCAALSRQATLTFVARVVHCDETPWSLMSLAQQKVASVVAWQYRL